MRRAALALFVLAACSGGTDDSTRPPAPPPTLVAPVDAAPADGGITQLPTYDPGSGMHLDEDDGGTTPVRNGGGTRSRRTLEILLRSSPSGATALVDGQTIGRTPTYWEGDFTGREREFTFVLKNHALARYRFVPITNGIVHARLEPVLPGVPGADGTVPPLPLPPPVAPVRRPAPPPDARPEPPDAAAVPDAPPAPTPAEHPGIGPTP